MEAMLFMGLLAGLVWFWTDSTRIREYVLRHCVRLCKDINVQMLDQTVKFTRLRLARDGSGRVQIRRFYEYEFSIDGVDRWRGNVVLLGKKIEDSRMDHPDGPIIFVKH